MHAEILSPGECLPDLSLAFRFTWSELSKTGAAVATALLAVPPKDEKQRLREPATGGGYNNCHDDQPDLP